MIINCTILVQAVNFLIAYLMIKYLLLNPALASIREDDEAVELATIRLEQQKEVIVIAQKNIAERLDEFKKTFLEHEPDVSRAFERSATIVPGVPPLPTIGHEEIQTLAQQTADKLIDEVAHVY